MLGLVFIRPIVKLRNYGVQAIGVQHPTPRSLYSVSSDQRAGLQRIGTCERNKPVSPSFNHDLSIPKSRLPDVITQSFMLARLSYYQRLPLRLATYEVVRRHGVRDGGAVGRRAYMLSMNLVKGPYWSTQRIVEGQVATIEHCV
jgi:hypothetical protein